jgi:pimeloyl-ACP methyl ester carboxylesterase
MVAEIAEYFQKQDFTVLIYDPRSIGSSGGMPRNEIHPARNVEDYHDALTFLKTQSLVDPKRIAYWGFSFSGMVALVAAALDKRAQAVIAMCPLTIWEFPAEKWPRVLSKAMKDRESCIVGGNKPVYIPMLTETGENPAGFGGGFDVGGLEMMAGAKLLQPTFELETTLSSYYHIAAWQPFPMLPFVSPTPAMIVTPENDVVSPAALQKSLVFDVLGGNGTTKRLLVVEGKGHMDVLQGDDFEKVLQEQVKFLREILG